MPEKATRLGAGFDYLSVCGKKRPVAMRGVDFEGRGHFGSV